MKSGLTDVASDSIERLKNIIFVRQNELRWFRLQNAFQYSCIDFTEMKKRKKKY